VIGGLHEVRNRWLAAEQGWTENDSGEDFADNFGLAQPDEEISQGLREANQKQEYEQDRSEVRVGQVGARERRISDAAGRGGVVRR
jgi:hypothetical protein